MQLHWLSLRIAENVDRNSKGTMRPVITLLIFLSIFGCSKSPEEKAQALFDDASDLLDRGQFAQADSVFRMLLADHTTSSLGFLGTGLVLERQGQIYDALGAYLKTNRLDRTFSPALMAMGRVFRNLDEPDLAAAAYFDCSGLPDSQGVAIARFAVVQTDDRQTARALAALKAADTTGADKTMIQLIRARIYAQRMQYDSADAAYGAVISKAANSADLLQLAADYLVDRGLIDSAIILSELSTRKNDAGFDQQYAHFRRCLKHRYWWRARQAITQMTGGDSTRLAYLGFSVQYGLAADENFLASRASQRFIPRGNNSVTTYVQDADVQLRVGDNATVTANSTIIPTLVIEGNDTTAFARYLMGMLLVRYADLNEPAELATELVKTSGFAADRRAYRLTCLKQFFKIGEPEAWEPTLKAIEEVHGMHPDWLTEIGDMLASRSLKQFDEAEQYYRRALSADSTYAPTLRHMSSLFMRTGNYPRALAFFDEYRSLVDNNPDLALDRAYCLAFTGQVEQGSSAFQAALPRIKGDIGRVEAMSRLLEAKERVDLDGSLIRLMLLLSPENTDALLLAAKRDNDYGNTQSALETAERGLSIEPGNVHLAVQKARALHAKGEKETAYAQLNELVKRNQGDVEANLYLSALMASDQTQLPTAENMARMAHFWEMGSRRAVSNLAFVYLQAGKYDLAAGETQAMTYQHADWSEIQYLYGAAIFMQGKKNEARPYLERALELGLPIKYRDKAKELLARI